MQEIVLGDVSVARVVEYYGSVDLAPASFFPDAPEAAWRQHAAWLEPDFVDLASDVCVSAIQTWVLRSEGRTILVDTGVGNDKERPYSPIWSRRQGDFLGELAKAGVHPDDVDLVINTHLHVDHVGWNTRLEARTWVPTFPNATYLMPARDFDFWNPENGHVPRLGRGNQNVFEDSVAPVHEAGQTLLWDESHTIDGNLRLELAPGHTPGSSVLALTSGSDRALFVGDLLHSPLQSVAPDVNSCFCENPAETIATRRRLLGRASETNSLVLPAHWGGPGGAEVVRSGDTFDIAAWAPFARL
ncbi:MBL fold metallo-hydrolase [Streptomyces xanthochromogenes]|uniref:MBL fold metallo-hydrolase n=1 Tax=Streptomyces xanthochromogenes TaxID=67384 RepID=UPI0037FB6D8D